jgi:capsular polysaccharide biosynthesis protein
MPLIGLAAGFALGLALAAMLEFKERLIRTELDIQNHLGLSVFTVIPNLEPR